MAILVMLVAGCEPEPLGPLAEVDFSETGGGSGQVLIGAGDIATCENTRDDQTAALVDSLLVEHPDALVFTAGDNVYQNGTAQEYAECYEPSWGRFKDRTWATIGNHEYDLGNADPTFDYFGERVGPRDLGYYSLDVGDWHLVMLNSNTSFVPVEPGSPQDQWLRADLAATTKSCVMAVFHHPRFYSCSGNCDFTSNRVKPLWDALYEYGADVVINGHAHHYERFAPQDPDGSLDPDYGIRQFIVGTGSGASVKDVVAPNSEVRNDEGAAGVIKLTLYDDKSYEWEFVPVPGRTFTDSGTGTCSGTGPIADFTWAVNEFTVDFTDTSSDPDGTVTEWSWNFGDGSTSTLQNPSHTYAAVGTYTVSLTVTDSDGLTGTTTRSVPAGPHPPTADFSWTANELAVNFTDTSSDPDGTVEAWSWDFGDGATSTLQNPAHTYAVDGSYVVTLTTWDNEGLTGTTTQTVSVALRTGAMVYVTSTASGTVGGIAFEDEDILAYDGDTDTWSVHFDGSDVGLDSSSDGDVRSFALLANGDILLRLKDPITLPDVGTVEPSDIVRFNGSTGPNTSGTFSLYFRGADVGLAREEIDAIGFAPDGRLVISTEGGFSVPGASGDDEDLIALDPGGASWSLYFDGSDVGLADSSDEDISGVWIDDLTGDIYLSTKRAFAVPEVSGDETTVFVCKPAALGSPTSCSFSSYWTGSEHGLTSNDVIGIHIEGSTPPPPPPNQAPTASFTYACTDVGCSFTDASNDPDGTVMGWNWVFGDGGTSTLQNPSHTYAAAGTYTVTLTVTDNDGATSLETTKTVTVTAPPPPNQSPTADFSWTATDLSVAFTDASNDPDGTVTGWNWSFGDGGASTLQNPSHTYAAAGTYTVTLTVTDNDGATSQFTETVGVLTVSAITPSAVATGSSIDLTITGSGFAPGATLALENGSGPAPSLSNVVVVNGTTITATLETKSGGPPRNRLWDVRVSNPDGSSGRLVEGLTVTASK
jgi:PKD repeat protein